MSKTSLQNKCILELRNRGPYREVVLIDNTPIIVIPDSTLRVNDNGAFMTKGTNISYNSLTINVKETYESTSRDCNFREIGFMRDGREYRRTIHDRTQREPTRQEGTSQRDKRRARSCKGTQFNQFLRHLFFRAA